MDTVQTLLALASGWSEKASQSPLLKKKNQPQKSPKIEQRNNMPLLSKLQSLEFVPVEKTYGALILFLSKKKSLFLFLKSTNPFGPKDSQRPYLVCSDIHSPSQGCLCSGLRGRAPAPAASLSAGFEVTLIRCQE